MKGKFAKLSDALTTVRLWTVNLLTLAFLIYVVVIVVSIIRQAPPKVDPQGRVLIIAPEGQVVDQEVQARTIEFPDGLSTQPQIQYRDLVRVIRAAATDERLLAVTIDFSKAGFSGPTTALGIADELAKLRGSGKPLLAYSDSFTTASYLMASQADEVYVHPAGAISVAGLGGYRPYVRELLEKLRLNVHDFSQGEYKSAGELMLRDSMSDADREQTREFLLPLWAAFIERMAAGRGVEPALLQQYADDYPSLGLEEAAFSELEFAREQGLVDGFMTFPEYRAWMRERFGTDEEAERETYPHIMAGAYLAQLDDPQPDADDAVAVVFAQGILVRGEQKPGVAGVDDIADLVRRAYEDETTRAIVLRVNSPGGGVMASEMVRTELLTAQERGLPVVVSMGDVAASGGMWVSAPADRIFAMPTTITGSIGVALVIPTAERLYAWAGIHFDGVRTSEYSDWSQRLPIDDKLAAILSRRSESTYRRFVDVVAAGRQREPDYIDSIGGGRVWLASKAQEIGLVDELGDLEDAIAAAASMAELTEYRVDYVTRELPWSAQLLRDLLQRSPLKASPIYTDTMDHLEALFAPLAATSEPRVEAVCTDCLVNVE